MTRFFKVEHSTTRPVRRRLIANGEVIKIGDFITDESTGAANVDAVTEPILGFVADIVDNEGRSFRSNTVDVGAFGGTFDSVTSEYTAAADNETVDGIQVEYFPVREGDQLVATLDAAKGTTTGSNLEGYYLAILATDSSLLDESTASTTIANTQFIIRNPFLSGPDDEVVVEVHLRQSE